MLAEGADRLVSEIALNSGCAIAAVIPFKDYERDFAGQSLERYREQLAACLHVVQLNLERSDRGYSRAGMEIVRRGSVLLAIWDGTRAEGPGGTAQIVGYAQKLGKEVIRVDPTAGWVQTQGARIDQPRDEPGSGYY